MQARASMHVLQGTVADWTFHVRVLRGRGIVLRTYIPSLFCISLLFFNTSVSHFSTMLQLDPDFIRMDAEAERAKGFVRCKFNEQIDSIPMYSPSRPLESIPLLIDSHI